MWRNVGAAPPRPSGSPLYSRQKPFAPCDYKQGLASPPDSFLPARPSQPFRSLHFYSRHRQDDPLHREVGPHAGLEGGHSRTGHA